MMDPKDADRLRTPTLLDQARRHVAAIDAAAGDSLPAAAVRAQLRAALLMLPNVAGSWRGILAARYKGAGKRAAPLAHFLTNGRRKTACGKIDAAALADEHAPAGNAACPSCVSRVAQDLARAAGQVR